MIKETQDNTPVEEVSDIMASDDEFSGDSFFWPVPSDRDRLEAEELYGMRMHPVLHEWYMNSGIDINDKTGALYCQPIPEQS